MKLASIFFAGAAMGQDVVKGLSDQDRLDRVVGLMHDWIDTNIPDWKRVDKVRNRLDWMSDRLSANLNDGCRMEPDEVDLADEEEVRYSLCPF